MVWLARTSRAGACHLGRQVATLLIVFGAERGHNSISIVLHYQSPNTGATCPALSFKTAWVTQSSGLRPVTPPKAAFRARNMAKLSWTKFQRPRYCTYHVPNWHLQPLAWPIGLGKRPAVRMEYFYGLAGQDQSSRSRPLGVPGNYTANCLWCREGPQFHFHCFALSKSSHWCNLCNIKCR